MDFNSEQKLAISARDKNVLISAGAGSGKTRVLVERIIEMIKNKELSINDVLVMTFARDAAKEMKKRIKDSLIDIVYQTYDTDIINQLSLLQSADISTIDSFCKKLLDENFSKLALIEPNFRIADEREINLIKNEIIEKVFEEKCLEKKYKIFFKSYVRRDTELLKEIFISGLSYMSSIPFPLDYIEDISKNFKTEKLEKLYVDILRNELKIMHKTVLDYLDTSSQMYEFLKNKNINNQDIEKVREKINFLYEYLDYVKTNFLVCSNENFINNILQMVDVEKIKSNKKSVVDYAKPMIWDMRDACNDLRKRVILTINAIKYFFGDRKEEVDNDILYMELLKDIYKKVENKKIEKNILEISDLQKFALNLLYERIDGKLQFTELAKEIQKKYKQVFVDEYQDTSLIQEAIIRAVSNDYKNKNVFLVGDVKQSIYAFRNSKPNLFIEKVEDFSGKSSSKNLMIELNKNYRSSVEVIDFVNEIFKRVMIKDFGSVDYEKNGQLQFARDEEKNRFKNFDKRVEINILKHGKKNDDDKNPIKYDKAEEARYIANRIKKLREEGYKYSDIVILSRAPIALADIYVKEFKMADIPLVCELKSGFYISYEIRLMIDILTIIDNPLNDIALSSVLASKIYGVSNNELSFLRLIYKKYKGFSNTSFFSLYNIISKFDAKNNKLVFDSEIQIDDASYKKNSADKNVGFTEILDELKLTDDSFLYTDIKKEYDIDIINLSIKIKKFLDDLRYFRSIARYKSVSSIISIIYEKTLLYNFFGSMRNGNIKMANLDMLIKVAKTYETSSYTGLYNFVKYIEKIKERKEDDGEAKVILENEDVVRLMSIHKSKGLEFPVVIMPNLDKKYRDLKSSIKMIFSEKYGASLNQINYKRRYEASTIKREVVINDKKNENLEEEMRLMYVATTRATEKLIFSFRLKTTAKRNFDDVNTLYLNTFVNDKYSIGQVKNIKSYAEFLKAGLGSFFKQNTEKKKKVVVNIIDSEISGSESVDEVYDDSFFNEKIDNKNANEYFERLKNNITTKYKNEILTKLKPKFSVSEIKKIDTKNLDDEKIQNKNSIIKNDEDVDVINDLSMDSERRDGTEIGNSYHKFMQNFDFTENFINNFSYIKNIDKDKINNFLNSTLGTKIKTAFLNNNLFREKRFMKLFDYKDIVNYKIRINGETDELKYELEKIKNIGDKKVIVQGVVDAFYIYVENGKPYIDIVDYKTDGLNNKNINNDFVEVLKKRYSIQLEIYKRAISEISGIEVKNSYIYSFALDKEIKS